MCQAGSSNSERALQGIGRGWFALVAILLLNLNLGLPGCRSEPAIPWNPVIEETGFSYLEATAKRIREYQQQARQDLAAGRTDKARNSMERAGEAAAVLVFYALPITEVRQLVYDAGRLQALGNPQQAARKLDRASRLMQQIGETDGPSLLSETAGVQVMIKDLLIAMGTGSPAVPEKFKALGHKVNLLALKSDLVLSGVRFSEKKNSRDGL